MTEFIFFIFLILPFGLGLWALMLYLVWCVYCDIREWWTS